MNLSQWLKNPFTLWNRYWFSPASLFNLAICRIFIVGFQLFHLMTNNFWGKLIEYANLPDFLYAPLPILQILVSPLGADYRPSFSLTAIAFWLAIVTGILALVGLWTNLNLIIFAVTNIFLQAYLYSFRDFHHSEALVMIALIAIALSPAGGVLSVDDLWRRMRLNLTREQFEAVDITTVKSKFARWAPLLIQWIFALVYLDSALSKLSKDGLEWMNGYTLQYYLWQDGLIWESDFGVWFAQQHTLAVFSSWVAILFEATFFLVLLFPKLIWFYIPLGISFHTGIYLAQEAPFLKYIPVYSVFIPWSAIAHKFSLSRISQLSQKVEVIYDENCPFHLRLVTLFSYFDWFNRLSFKVLTIYQQKTTQSHPEMLDEYHQDLWILMPDGSTKGGFLAVRKILGYLPPLWLAKVLFHPPFASTIGLRIYQLFAPKPVKANRLIARSD